MSSSNRGDADCGPPRPRVVHLTRDFPDPFEQAKSHAIRRLVDATADQFDHFVISLDRQDPALVDLRGWLGRGIQPAETRFPYGTAIEYRAPPRGVFHAGALERLGEWLAERIADELGPRPTLLVGHKLTIEGLAVRRAAELLRVPYAISIQGNTDELILRTRPDLARAYARVVHGAAMVFPFSPWALAVTERRLGKLSLPARMLPCMTELDTPLAPQVGGNGLVTAFHLRNWRTKNFDRIVAAQRSLARSGHPLPLAVVGGGADPESEQCRRIGERAAGVTFEGPMEPADLPPRFNRASAFVMPSRRESFGMVLLEALFAGLPIIYPAGQAVDGYFDGAPFALRVDPGSTRAIARAMAFAVANEAELKAALAEWQQSPAAIPFTRQAIAAQFAAGLTQAIAGRAP